MKQNFTLFYLLNNFEGDNSELINFDEFQDICDALEAPIIKPRECVVDNILNFSKAYKLMHLELFDDVELIVN